MSTSVSLDACVPGGLAAISLAHSEDAPAASFSVSLENVIKRMEEAAAKSAGPKGFDRLTLEVALPATQLRDFADRVLQALCRTDISWNELEITMPQHILKRDDGQDSEYAEKMSQNKDGVLDRVSERFRGTCVVYKGEEQNVPWPWLDVTEMARFQVRSLRLKGEISANYFRALVQKANMDGTSVELGVYVDGIFNDHTQAVAVAAEGAGTSRIQSLKLGSVKRPITLQSLLLAGQVYKSITELEAKVTETPDPKDIADAIKLCYKLESVEVICKRIEVGAVVAACTEKGMEVSTDLRKARPHAIVIAKKNKV